MNVKCLPLGEIAANCYMISTEEAAVVIDPGEYSPDVAEFLKESSGKARIILLTHGHFDHIGGAARLREETDTPIVIGEEDAPALSDAYVNLSSVFGIPLKSFDADRTVCDGERIAVGDIEFTAMTCPGHTVGSICYLTGNLLFSGDVLFERSVGRTDFPGGDTKELMRSIARLMELDLDTLVLSGHGGETTLRSELNSNPYIRGII